MRTRSVVVEHSPLDRWTAEPSVSVAVRDGETVLLDLRVGAYYVLNETGGTIWGALRRGGEAGVTLGDVVGVLEAEYDAPAEQIRGDVAAMLARWVRDRLVHRVPASRVPARRVSA
jgi:hypothetical protein